MVDMLTKQLECEIFPVHRLDTTTTGLMVFAKNEASAAALSRQLTEHRLSKEYLSICHGRVDNSGRMTDFLYHDRIKNKSFVVENKRKGSKEAILDYELISYDEKRDLSCVKIALHTGRTHQIRVQLASRKHPLYGDGKYGAKDKCKIALHSYKLTVYHPKSNEEMSFTSYPDEEIFKDFLQK